MLAAYRKRDLSGGSGEVGTAERATSKEMRQRRIGLGILGLANGAARGHGHTFEQARAPDRDDRRGTRSGFGAERIDGREIGCAFGRRENERALNREQQFVLAYFVLKRP